PTALAAVCPSLFSFHAPAPTARSTLSLHDALPISLPGWPAHRPRGERWADRDRLPAGALQPQGHGASPLRLLLLRAEDRRDPLRSEEHTSELQSRENLVCRLLLEKKKT